MPYPLTRSKAEAAASGDPHVPMMVPPAEADPPLRAGMPFRKMYETRDQVRKATDELNKATATLVDAQKNPKCTERELETRQAAIRFKSAELKSLMKKLGPMEANFRKTLRAERSVNQSMLAPPAKKQRLDDRPEEMKEAPFEIAPVVQMLNTATLDVPLPLEGCPLTPDECQYNHLERLRRQYARSFELFCEEMDTISDTCLTGICLILPDMPWSIALSRLAFLLKSTLDSPDSRSTPSDINHLPAGTTIGCEQHFHHVSFGPLTSIGKNKLYTPINQHQLGKMVHDKDVGLIFPFEKSYGHIFVDKWQDNSFHRVDTLLPIPPTYTSEEVQPFLQKLPTWTEVPFNIIMDSLFWYARKRNVPFRVWGSRHFSHWFPLYQCPFCHGFDNFVEPVDSLIGSTAGYDNFIQALEHMLFAHTRVPLTRKVKFLLEEIQQCPVIDGVWKTILRDDYDASMSMLATGVIPRAIADLCGHGTFVDPIPTAVSNSPVVNKSEERVASEVEAQAEVQVEVPAEVQAEVQIGGGLVEDSCVAEREVEG
ncbi:hypothetical protein F4803DRAFT_573865 [Xylaria telfairii]|nr:hypothetical protein F4803DRAFT_573865 [Xylaria telfairii]